MPAGPPEKLTRGTLAMLLTAAVFAIGMVVATLAALVRCEEASNEGRKATPASSRAVQEIVAAQRAELGEEPEWVNKKAGILSIPVERAMDVVIDEVGRNPRTATPPPSASAGEATSVPSPATASSTRDAG